MNTALHKEEWRDTRIVVVGDVMLDRYWQGSTQRISPEAPVPVVAITETIDKPGGAANVALNIAAVGAQVTLVAIVGDDEHANRLESQLSEASVDCCFIRRSNLQTTCKLRVISQQQQVIRLDFEEPVSNAWGELPLDTLTPLFSQADAVLVSDYGKGGLANCQAVIRAAQSQDCLVLVDPKGRDYHRYQGADMITPNRLEFETVLGQAIADADLPEQAQRLLKKYQLGACLLTRGAQGMSLYRPDQASIDRPTRAREVFDVTGAGDTVIAFMTLALAKQYDFSQAMRLANTAAGITVSKLGASSVSLNALRRALRAQDAAEFGEVSREDLHIYLEDARAQGERIVMTNGCFDILHRGHVSYLQAAKRLGDRLIVAVNDDDSIKRLKGPTRPINSLAERMAVLASLRCVDWVVAFSDDTPLSLIDAIRPEVLVKGADYQLHEVVGADLVQSYGGQVALIELVPNCSTSAIINKAQGEPA